jgi:hypothetical protein
MQPCFVVRCPKSEPKLVTDDIGVYEVCACGAAWSGRSPSSKVENLQEQLDHSGGLTAILVLVGFDGFTAH